MDVHVKEQPTIRVSQSNICLPFEFPLDQYIYFWQFMLPSTRPMISTRMSWAEIDFRGFKRRNLLILSRNLGCHAPLSQKRRALHTFLDFCRKAPLWRKELACTWISFTFFQGHSCRERDMNSPFLSVLPEFSWSLARRLGLSSWNDLLTQCHLVQRKRHLLYDRQLPAAWSRTVQEILQPGLGTSGRWWWPNHLHHPTKFISGSESTCTKLIPRRSPQICLHAQYITSTGRYVFHLSSLMLEYRNMSSRLVQSLQVQYI